LSIETRTEIAFPSVVVADPADRLTDEVGDVDLGGGRKLAGDHGHARVHERLAGDARVGVLAEAGVEHGVRDLVGDLVGVTFGDGLGGEEMLSLCKLQLDHSDWFLLGVGRSRTTNSDREA
jgi:hypothetical protein